MTEGLTVFGQPVPSTQATDAEVAAGYVAKAGGTMTGELIAPDLSLTGITGAVIAVRLVGGTAGGPPTTGTFVTGDFVVTTLGNLWVCTAGGSPGTWVAVGMNGFVRKTGDETVTSSTVLQDDDHLLATVVANATYEFRLVAFYDGGTTGDIKLGFTVPASSTLIWGINGATAGVSNIANATANWTVTTASGGSAVVGANGAATKMILRAEGLLRTAGTAGTLQLQWAQSSSDATATTLFTDSYLIVRRVA